MPYSLSHMPGTLGNTASTSTPTVKLVGVPELAPVPMPPDMTPEQAVLAYRRLFADWRYIYGEEIDGEVRCK